MPGAPFPPVKALPAPALEVPLPPDPGVCAAEPLKDAGTAVPPPPKKEDPPGPPKPSPVSLSVNVTPLGPPVALMMFPPVAIALTAPPLMNRFVDGPKMTPPGPPGALTNAPKDDVPPAVPAAPALPTPCAPTVTVVPAKPDVMRLFP